MSTSENIISVKNLKKVYHDGETATIALNKISFDVRKGEFLAIMGPSGSGGHGDNLAPFVVAAGGANPVGHVRGRTLRTLAELRQGEHAVIRATHALTTS